MITLSCTLSSITLPNPVFGYKTVIDLSLDFVQIERNVSIFDNGGQYDKRSCSCSLLLDAYDNSKLNKFLNNDARGIDVGLSLDSSGFQPFGSDKGDAGAFTISMSLQSQSGIQEEPWLYFRSDLHLVNVSTYPSYGLPDGVAEGNLQIGNISGLRYPPNLAQSKTEYAINIQNSEGSNSFYIDKSNTRDYYETVLNMDCNRSKTAALLAYLCDVARDNTFSVVSSDNNFIFGYDKNGSGTYNVKLSDGKFIVTHELPDRYLFDIALVVQL